MGNHNDEVPEHPNYVSEPKGYALSGKIMLSAIIILFAVVVIMVCLHVYARWYILRARRRQIRRARRRTHLVFYIEPDNPSNIIPIPTQGLDASLLKALPTFTYVANKGESDEEEGGVNEVLECAVCLSEFEEKEKGRLLPKCKHCFHVECIDMWFHSHDTCPLCRAPVDSNDVLPPLPPPSEVVVELAELMQSQPQPAELTQEDVGSTTSQGESSSSPINGGRRKGLVSAIEVPRRSQSFCFPGSGSGSSEFGSGCSPGGGSGFKSPTNRILSLRRILSREKRSPLPSPSASGASCSELDLESGRVGSSSSNQVLTPR